jgi:hypothetical protein
MTQHIIYSPETAYGTWVTPADWLRVDSCSIQAARENIKLPSTGSGRGRYMTVQGAKPVAGTIALPFWCKKTDKMWRTVLRDWNSTLVSTGVYDNCFLFDDTLANLSVSIQQQYSSTVGLNFLSNVMKAFKITAASKSQVQLGWDFEAKDEALMGVTNYWDYDPTVASPAALSTPAYATAMRPLMFYDCLLKLGGTVALSTKKLVVTGGTQTKRIGTVDISADLGLTTDDYVLAQDPTRQELMPGNRVIAVTFDVLWSDLDLTFYNAMRAGTALTLELNMIGPIISSTYKAECHICIPNLVIDAGRLPDIAADETPKRQSITAEAVVDATTGKDFGMWIRSLEQLT